MLRRDWTREELILAMNLYSGLSFGKFHKSNPEVIQLAGFIERTPSSVAMKLSNLASLDPAHQQRGIKGLSGASEADRRIWAEFHADWERLAVESEILRRKAEESNEQRMMSDEAENESEVGTPAPNLDDLIYSGETEADRVVRVRLAQRFFRRAVLASYASRCCVSEIPVASLLVASHILPWRDHPAERANPRNGICLSRLHDGAFDRGLITFDEQFRLVMSSDLRGALANRVLRESFQPYEGQVMRLPDKFRPDPEFLRRHRERIFQA